MSKLPNPCLMLLTDRTRITPNWTLAQAIAPAIAGGCSAVVFRETDLPANHRLTVARFARDGVGGRVPLIIADDSALASTVGAQGNHLSTAQADIRAARKALGESDLVGVSVRDREEAELAAAQGAGYLLIEYEWSRPACVLDHFRALREGIAVPFIIGTDMDVDVVGECLAAGAAGIAICEPGMAAYDRTAACKTYSDAMRQPPAETTPDRNP
jgi:thiamine-phosphate pyrophosphorylase